MSAVKDRRWPATESDPAAIGGRRPVTPAEIFREPEGRRRLLRAAAMSFTTTVGR